jgi:uncharacterized membrane protein
MKRTLAAFTAALIAFCACDFVWLAVVARNYYQAQIGSLMLEQPNWIAAAIFYPLYTAGIVFFCVGPALARDSWTRASISGVLLGLVAYATYDLTNLATLRGWPTAVSVIDVLWGMFVSGVAATAGFLAARAVEPGR